MQIVVASRNPVKVAAVEAAFLRQFRQQPVETLAVSVPSGVGDQPRGDAETREGARNRVRNARDMHPVADFWVGLEGGIDLVDEQLIAFAWMAVMDRDGSIGEARSATLPLPPAVRALLEEGLELGDANDRVFGTVNSKQEGGAFGLLTGGRYTREGIYTQTVELALVPLLHPLFR